MFLVSLLSFYTASATPNMALSAETKKDLKFMLDSNRQDIVTRYASYFRCIRKSIEEKKITVSDFSCYLISLEAFESDNDVQCKLLTEIKPELEKANSIGKLFVLVLVYCASFMNIGILQHIVKEYELDNGDDKLKYPEYLLAFINKHRISEFAEINPELDKAIKKSKEVSLKLDIDATCKLSKITDLQVAVARILHLIPSAIQLYSIEDGCVIVKFLLPKKVADIIFHSSKIFSTTEEMKLQSLSVLWLKCDSVRFYVSKKFFQKETTDIISGNYVMQTLQNF